MKKLSILLLCFLCACANIKQPVGKETRAELVSDGLVTLNNIGYDTNTNRITFDVMNTTDKHYNYNDKRNFERYEISATQPSHHLKIKKTESNGKTSILYENNIYSQNTRVYINLNRDDDIFYSVDTLHIETQPNSNIVTNHTVLSREWYDKKTNKIALKSLNPQKTTNTLLDYMYYRNGKKCKVIKLNISGNFYLTETNDDMDFDNIICNITKGEN